MVHACVRFYERQAGDETDPDKEIQPYLSAEYTKAFTNYERCEFCGDCVGTDIHEGPNGNYLEENTGIRV